MKKAFITIVLITIISTITLAKTLPENIISFNFQDVSISYVFNAIADSNGINLIYNAENDKNVTVKLEDVKFKNAIEMLTSQNNLKYEYKNNILYIDTGRRIIETFNNPIPVPGKSNIGVKEKDNHQSVLVVSQENIEIDPGYRIKNGINKGTLIPAKLEVGLISSTRETPALVRITNNITYNKQLLIPEGAIMTGVGLADFNARQIFIDLDTLIIGSREVDIKAHMVKNDGTAGFVSEYRDLKKESFWQTFLLNFVGAIGSNFKDKLYIADDKGIQQPVEADSVKNELIDRTQAGIEGWTNELMADAQKHQAIITVNAGCEGFIFIDEKITLEKLTEGEDK